MQIVGEEIGMGPSLSHFSPTFCTLPAVIPLTTVVLLPVIILLLVIAPLVIAPLVIVPPVLPTIPCLAAPCFYPVSSCLQWQLGVLWWLAVIVLCWVLLDSSCCVIHLSPLSLSCPLAPAFPPASSCLQ